MGIYAKILQDSITGIYRTNAANKILQFINRIRNESDVNQARRFLIELMQNARDLAYKKPDGTPEPVSIRIRLSDTELEFSHNGKVFSVKDILSIIYHPQRSRVRALASLERALCLPISLVNE